MAGKLAAKNGKKNYKSKKKTYIFWRAGGGKIGGQKRKKIYVFLKLIWRAGGGKIGGQKREKRTYFLNLYFLEGCWRENWRQKTEKI